jgi:purine-binding chemotaxis protein CheW
MKRANINWELVRSRLQASEHALDEALSETPLRIETAYRERAIRLAKAPADPGLLGAGLPVMVFQLATERYAIELKELAEVVPLARYARVPGSLPCFLGVINLRGEILAVLDLGRLLGPYDDADQDSGFVLVIRRQGREIGLKVDDIEGIREVHEQDLTLPPPAKYAKGLISSTLILLNVDTVLLEAFSKQES